MKEAARAADAAGLWVLNRAEYFRHGGSEDEAIPRWGLPGNKGEANVGISVLDDDFSSVLGQRKALVHTFTVRAEASGRFANENAL